MFLAGYVPGIILCIGMMIMVHFISKKKNYGASRAKMADTKELWKLIKDAAWALLLPFGLIQNIKNLPPSKRRRKVYSHRTWCWVHREKD